MRTAIILFAVFSVSSTLISGSEISSDPNDIIFYQFSNPSDFTEKEVITFKDDDSLSASSFDCSKTTKILIPGFTQTTLRETGYPANIKNEYLKRYEVDRYNIIVVHWEKLSTAGCPAGNMYIVCLPAALENVPIVGQRIGHFIIWLHETCGLQWDLVHVFGHSLGSPVSGWAGHTVMNETGSKIGRLTELDPCGPPYYADVGDIRPMQRDDGAFTDVYHTSAFMGNALEVGHTNLFVNGGAAPQPGCPISEPTDLNGEGCSHSISTDYYAKSIALGNPETNPAARVCACKSAFTFNLGLDCCDSMIAYGEYCDSRNVGTFYVQYLLP